MEVSAYYNIVWVSMLFQSLKKQYEIVDYK